MSKNGWFTEFIWNVYSKIFIVLLVIYTPILAGTAVLLSFVPDNGRASHFIARLWSRINLKLAGTEVEVEGLENVDPNQYYIVMSNHQSHFDVCALVASLPLQLRWVMKKELRKIPIFGFAAGKIGHIYIDRSSLKLAMKSLDESVERLKQGISVVFFPEGTRSPDGNLLPFKKGGFMMGVRTKTPILPISISGTRRALPKGSLRLHKAKARLVIHPPVSTEELSGKDRNGLMEKVREIIQAGMDPD
jgi:1-acyl-sn-glycerol-3-phosphate acyltransferase